MIDEQKKLEFSNLCKKISSGELIGDGIGTYCEKRLHKPLKHFLCPDEKRHEVRIRPDGTAHTEREENAKSESGKGGFIADIFKNDEIIEIQTGSFYPMKKKIEFYLERTNYEITVAYPMAAIKWILWIDTQDGSIGKRTKSPKKCVASDILPELFWLSKCLSNERLHFKILLLEIEEYRLLDGWSDDKKRGSNRYERIPISLVDEVDFVAPDFAQALVLKGLDDNFTSKDFSSHTRLRGRKLSHSLKLLSDCGVIERGEKNGRLYTYKIKNKQ